MRRHDLVFRRLCTVTAVVVALTVAVPSGLERPSGGSRFPLAGLWDWLAAATAWSADPQTPVQAMGGIFTGVHRVSTDATRANGGNGSPQPAVPDLACVRQPEF